MAQETSTPSGSLPELDLPTVEQLREAAGRVERVFANMLEAGLFRKKAEGFDQEVLSELRQAREATNNQQLVEAEHRILSARVALQNAIQIRGPFWLLWHVHQVHWFAYHVIVILLILNVATGWLDGVLGGSFGSLLTSMGIADTFWSVPIEALGFGALGGTLRGMYWLHRQVSRRQYRVHFGMSHFATPWIGGLFGVFLYLATKVGLIILGDGNQVSETGSAGIWALIFVAGFNWQWALKVMSTIQDRALRSRDDSEDQGPEERDDNLGEDGDQTRGDETEREDHASDARRTE